MHTRIVVAAFAFAIAATVAPAADPSPATAAGVGDISHCTSARPTASGMRREIGMQTTDREGSVKQFKIRIYWKTAESGAARLSIRVVEPEMLAGSSYLVREAQGGDELYIYSPLFGKSTRVKGEDMTSPLWGTGVTYGELKQIQGLIQTGAAQRQPDSSIGGRPVYVLDFATDRAATGYRMIRSQFDQASCVLLKSELYASASEPVKTIEADTASLVSAGAQTFASSVTVRNTRDGLTTILSLTPPMAGELDEGLFDSKTFFSARE